MQDTFHEIASSILIADAELALTFIHVGGCRSEEEGQGRAFRYAARAYESICNSLSSVRMSKPDLERLGPLLQDIKLKLGETGLYPPLNNFVSSEN